jgi:hypothetical protein
MSCQIRSKSGREAGLPKAVREKRLRISRPLKHGFDSLKVLEKNKRVRTEDGHSRKTSSKFPEVVVEELC